MPLNHSKAEISFKGKRSNSFGFILLLSSVFVLFITILPLLFDGSISNTVVIISGFTGIAIALLFLWFWMATYYFIKNEILFARFGPFVWKIPVEQISFIRLNQETFGGTWKLTLAWKSMEIRYQKNKSIFISPEDEKLFLESLLKINGAIKIKS